MGCGGGVITEKKNKSLLGKSGFLLYQTEDGKTKIEVRLEDETVWMSQIAMAELFQTTVANINIHLKNIYEEGELAEEATIKDYLIVRQEGHRKVQRNVKHYSLEPIIAVGYRVKSHRGTQFRKWATERLNEYIIKGFTMDDERLKQAGGGNYFDELLARIRDIRSSEKVFWRKVLDIYATSIDYDSNTDVSREFFSVIQNKMHWAAHGQTAAEIIYGRADASKPNMGLTNWPGNTLRKTDTGFAKNYLNKEELDVLNRIVTMYLEFAELQALNRNPMTMRDWIVKLDDFLKLTGRDILTHAGKVSHDEALEKAHMEYEKYHEEIQNSPSPVERHFIEAENKIKQMETRKKEGR